MILKELQDEIVTVVFSELLRAQKEHGETFNSMPEAFSVIWEEIEEANEEMQRVQQKANDLWLANRRDDADAFRIGDPLFYRPMHAVADIVPHREAERLRRQSDDDGSVRR